jgi:hypothetical protein
MQRDATLAAAEQDATDAQQLADQLAERVRQGDPDVTAQQLAAQRQIADFAQLRVTAAQRRYARVREDDRARLAESARTAAVHLLGEAGAADIVAATTAAAAAVAELRRVIDARNARLDQVAVTVSAIDSSLTEEGRTGGFLSRPYGVWGDRRAIVVQSTGRVEQLSAGELAAAALVVGLGSDVDGYAEWSRARDLIGGLESQAVKALGEKVPGLADAWRYDPERFAAARPEERHRAEQQGRLPAPATKD